MKKLLKKLVAGLSASLVFFGSNVYAADGFLTYNGINIGVIIGVVLIVLVLLLGYKMDSADKKDDESPDKKKDNSGSLDNLPNDYSAIKEDMPYEEEEDELYEFEDTPKEESNDKKLKLKVRTKSKAKEKAA